MVNIRRKKSFGENQDYNNIELSWTYGPCSYAYIGLVAFAVKCQVDSAPSYMTTVLCSNFQSSFDRDTMAISCGHT